MWAGLCLSLLMAWPGCSVDPVPLSPLGPDSVVLAFGDSLTKGTGVSRKQSYPALLEKRLGCKVINAGVPGEVTAQGLLRLPGLLDRHAPDLLILCHGGNDMLQRLSKEKMAANLDRMIRMAIDRGVEVVLVGVPAPGLMLSVDEAYDNLAERHRLPYEGEVMSEILSSPTLKSDAIHPNAEGYRKMAEAVAALIAE